MFIRPASPDDAPAIARVHVATWRSTYRGIIPETVLNNLNEAESEARWHSILTDPDNLTRLLVALDEAEGVVGFAACGPERTGLHGFRGEVYALYVLQRQQGQGAGRALVAASARSLLERGMDDMLIWVLADNTPSCVFYERIGGVRAATTETDIGGKALLEVGYGWRNLPGWLATQQV